MKFGFLEVPFIVAVQNKCDANTIVSAVSMSKCNKVKFISPVSVKVKSFIGPEQ